MTWKRGCAREHEKIVSRLIAVSSLALQDRMPRTKKSPTAEVSGSMDIGAAEHTKQVHEGAVGEVAAVWTKLTDLVGWEGNPRINAAAIPGVAESIKAFGFGAPLVAQKGTGFLIAGHTRIEAARLLGMSAVPVRFIDITDAKAKALALADNKLGELADWDEAKLAEAVRALQDEDVALLEAAGFDEDDLSAILREDEDVGLDEGYTKKIVTPIYTPKGDKPAVQELFDDSKTKTLVSEIRATKLPAEVANFLEHAAQRHTIFNFRNIAEFYAHADAETQALMERSAVVIIDFGKAIENGFVRLSKHMGELVDREDAAFDA